MATFSPSIQRGVARLNVACFLAANLLPGFSNHVMAQELQIDPRLEIKATYTDNVTLVPKGQPKSGDAVVAVSPGLNIRAKSSRYSASLDYWADYMYFVGENATELRHSLFGVFDAEVIENRAWVTARAGVRPTFLDRQQSLSGSTANRSDNRRMVQNYAVEGRVKGKVKDIADWTASYEYGLSLSPADNLDDPTLTVNYSDAETHRVAARMTSGDRFRNFEWGAFATSQRVYRSLDVKDYENDAAGVEGWLKFNRKWAAVASAGWTANNLEREVLSEDGFTWDVGVRYIPSLAADLLVRHGRQGKRKTWVVQGSYLFNKRTDITINYSDTISATSLVANDNLRGFRFDNNMGIVDSSGFPVDEGEPSFTLSDSDFRRVNGMIMLKWRDRRNNLYINANREKRTFDNLTSGSTISWGLAAGFDRKIDRRTTLSGKASFRRSDFEDGSRSDDYILGSVEWKRNIAKNFIGAISYNYSQRISSDVTGDLKENALTFYLRGTF